MRSIGVGCALLLSLLNAAAHAQSPQELGRLVTQAGKFEEQENYPAAIRAYEQSLMIATQLFGAKHANVAALSQAQALLHVKLGQYDQARTLLEKVVEISKTIQDADLLAESVNNLATAEWELGRYARALELHEYGLNLLTSRYGESSPQVAISRSNLAGVYSSLGRYAEAEPLYENSVRVLERQGRDYQLTLADTLMNQADLYLLQGETARTQPLLLRAIGIKETLLGPNHHQVARVLNNLAGLYNTLGQYEKAEQTHLRVLKILESSLGAEHLDTCRSVLNLAGTYQRQKQHDKALPYYERALRTRQAQLEADHPLIALTLHNLAGLHVDMGNEKQAETLYRQALKTRQERLGEDHPDVATTLLGLAMMHMRQQQFNKAEPLWNQVMTIREARLPAGHPDLAFAEQGLGATYAATDRWEEAAEAYDKSRRGMRKYADQVLPALSESEQLRFLSEIDDPCYHSALSLLLRTPENHSIAELSAGWVLNGKAVAQQTLAQRALLLRDANDPLLSSIAKTVAMLRKQLASLFLVSGEGSNDTARQQKLEALTREEQEQSSQLVLNSGRSLGTGQWVETSAVRDRLPSDALLIEIARFRLYDFRIHHEKQELPEHYVAWIIPPAGSGQIEVVDLGEAEPIDAAVKAARLALQQAPQQILNADEVEVEESLLPVLEELAQHILHPLLKKTGDRQKIYLSPDSVLWLVPWNALPLKDGRYAVEQYDLRLVVSGRTLIANEVPVQPGRPVMFANPNYDLDPAEVQAAIAKVFRGQPKQQRGVRATPPGIFKLGTVPRLPGTEIEASAVKPKLEQYTATTAHFYTEEYALEIIFKRLQQPRVLVISTHGFFRENADLSSEPNMNRGVDNPLLRCGLLFAGCNKPSVADQGDTEDGILTGFEILGTNLRGTELVVLSACETGLGDVRNGEGVAGLRQAFQLAGAKSVVATLWSIPDNETARLITDFFARLAATGDKPGSLRNAQLARIEARRNRYGAAHPYFWAAFTMTGD